MSSGLTWLEWSPRVAPGLLSRQAWDLLRDATVLTGIPDHPLAAALATAGVEVEVEAADPDALLARAADEALVWVPAADGDPDLLDALLDRLGEPGLALVTGSYDLPGARLLDVVSVMDRLRSPGGCPWDAEQTHASLRRYLLEEAYEADEALEHADLDALREELGDVLLQVAFHARLATEAEHPWSIDDVAGDLVDKLVRRHPHVFAGVAVSGADEVSANWDAIKRAEKQRTTVTEGVPFGQPALALAAALLRRGAKAGRGDVLPAAAPVPPGEMALGEHLLAVVAAAAAAGTDAEHALRTACRALARRLDAPGA